MKPEMLEPRFGDIFEWPNAWKGKKTMVMFIARDHKGARNSFDDTMTCIYLVGAHGDEGVIHADNGPARMFDVIDQPR